MNSRRHPVRNLTKQLLKHDAFATENIAKISAFYLKLILQGPFRLYEKVRWNSRIKNHELSKDPIFIIGHWRSGTSFLQYLLGQDQQFGFMNKFQVAFPDIFLSSESSLKPLVNCIPQSINLIRDAQNMSINLELDSPSEIEIALTTMISPTSLHWGHIFPKNAEEYFDKYLFFDTAKSSEIEKWKQDYRYLIKKTSLKNDGRQLLIKSPGNTARSDELLEMYPEARFIFIYRNPYDVFYSSKKLWNTLLDNLALQDIEKQQMEEEIITLYRKLMQRYLEQRNKIPAGQLAEIRFEDFVSQPVTELRNVYNQLELGRFEDAQAHFQDFLDKKTEGKSSSYDYENRIIKEINTNWEFAFDAWNYPLISSEEVVPAH